MWYKPELKEEEEEAEEEEAEAEEAEAEEEEAEAEAEEEEEEAEEEEDKEEEEFFLFPLNLGDLKSHDHETRHVGPLSYLDVDGPSGILILGRSISEV